MIILKPIATAQTLKFIGRFDNADSIVLRDEQDNTEVTLNADFDLSTYYLTASIIFDLKEGRFYNLTAYKSLVSDYETRVEADGGTIEALTCLSDYNQTNKVIVYKDKIFCTAQTDGYSINSGDYIQHSSNNDYITL